MSKGLHKVSAGEGLRNNLALLPQPFFHYRWGNWFQKQTVQMPLAKPQSVGFWALVKFLSSFCVSWFGYICIRHIIGEFVVDHCDSPSSSKRQNLSEQVRGLRTFLGPKQLSAAWGVNADPTSVWTGKELRGCFSSPRPIPVESPGF